MTAWFSLACLCSVAFAQVDAPPPAPVDVAATDRPRVNIDNPEVYLNDSFEASDALAKAQVFANRGRWTEAAEVLQRAIDGAGDKLVRVAGGSYTGISRHISDLIARDGTTVLSKGDMPRMKPHSILPEEWGIQQKCSWRSTSKPTWRNGAAYSSREGR